MHEVKLLPFGSQSCIAYKKLDFGSKVTVVFLHGFMSSMQSTKSSAIYSDCLKNKTNCVIFDYLGHGKSSGDFVKCTLSDWKSCCCHVIESLVDTPFVVVGSSLGGWLAILVALCFPEKVAGIVGLASAADFTEDLSLTESETSQLEQHGLVEISKNQCSYIITRDLISDGKNHLLLNKGEIPLRCPVSLLHGLDDNVVHHRVSVSIAEKIKSENVNVHIMRPGNHNLDDPTSMHAVLKGVREMVAMAEGVS